MRIHLGNIPDSPGANPEAEGLRVVRSPLPGVRHLLASLGFSCAQWARKEVTELLC